MKTLKEKIQSVVLGAAVTGLAIGFSAFAPSDGKTQNAHYFRNDGSKASPQWQYIGQIEPSPLDCSVNDLNYCYGVSEMGADPSGQPTGPVTAVKDGDYTP